MRIIAIDDEIFALEELEEAIQKASPQAELITFREPETLLEYAGEHPCDVAFLDVEMGSMSGVEVAKKLKIRYPGINIIFVTGYSQYMATALRLHVSGYLMKPVTVDAVREELENLRNPLPISEEKPLYARCFGTFDVYVKGQHLIFERSKAKEMLAYLIDRRGSMVTSGELRAVLWSDAETDENTRSYLSKVQKDLNVVLERAGVSDVLVTSWGKYAVNPDRISCDYYDYLDNKPEGIRAYNGEYMAQYDWGELQNVLMLDQKINHRNSQ